MRKAFCLLLPLILSFSLLLVTSKSYDVSFSNLSTTNTGGGTHDIEVVDDIAYVIDTFHDDPGGLVSINISDPSNPQILDSFFEGGIPSAVSVKGDYAYVVNRETGLKIFDVSNPSNITKIGSYYDGGSSSEIEVIDDIAYIADGSEGLVILNVSDPTSPSKINQFNAFYVPSLTIFNDKAYLIDHRSTYSGLVILDISDLNNLQIMGSYSRTQVDFIFPTVHNDLIFLANHHENTGEVQILNVSDPTEIVFISSIKGEGEACMMEIVNDLLFVSTTAGIEVVNIEDVNEPYLICSYTAAGVGYDISVIEDIIVFSARNAGLGIYEYSLVEIPEETNGFIYCLTLSPILIIYLIKRRHIVKRESCSRTWNNL